MPWSSFEIDFDMIAEDSDHPVVVVMFTTPGGAVSFMAEVRTVGRSLIATGVHAEGPGANGIGTANLRVLARVALERLDYDAIEIEGAVRTTGASPGRRPRRVRFSR